MYYIQYTNSRLELPLLSSISISKTLYKHYFEILVHVDMIALHNYFKFVNCTLTLIPIPNLIWYLHLRPDQMKGNTKCEQK